MSFKYNIGMKKFFYRVGAGETVISLAARFGVPPIAIINSNGINSEVSEGDVIFIEETGGEIYTVQPFDTLNSVAEKFHLLPEKIAEINCVDYLFYGLKIIIPI